jgi:hypothetical protein
VVPVQRPEDTKPAHAKWGTCRGVHIQVMDMQNDAYAEQYQVMDMQNGAYAEQYTCRVIYTFSVVQYIHRVLHMQGCTVYKNIVSQAEGA